MAKSNREKVGQSLTIFKSGLLPFVKRELASHLGDDWENKAVSDLKYKPKSVDEWDNSAILNIMCNNWYDVFSKTLSYTEKNLVFELRDVRNNVAHEHSFSSDDTYRALDSMERLLQSVGAGEVSLEMKKRKMEVMRQKIADQTRHDTKKRAGKATEGDPSGGLTPWRDIVEPHEDVASGNYQQAEFAADLYQVYTKIASNEYGEPIEFFQRTFLTQGLKDLLNNALKRWTSTGGDPVVALQTNFGGGKTHSMLALYHLCSGTPVSDLANVDELINSAGIKKLPEIKRAVLVGQYLTPGESRKMSDGTKVNTIWGELAWQLGGKDGYKLVKEADTSGTNPGRALIDLFKMAGPCLVLIDEWVSYARQLYEKHDLPAGSFDTQFTFAQALTEAAAASPNALVVVSIPASDIEVGGTTGKEALNRLENVVARKEATWQPASSEEGFEIVRRRLFKSLGNEEMRKRNAVIRAFIENYRKNAKDFPADVSSADYEQRMMTAYPIHPDLFDRLYTEWSTLDRFQRTRGVLRLMASVIHELWENEDKNLMILPGMLPLQYSSVTKELVRYLEPSWPVIVESDVDGPDSTPLGIDRENSNLGRYSATRRVARAVFLGTAPMSGTANRGKDIKQINIACVQPGESLATFGDALRRLQNKARYLHTDGERSFYDPAQNISRDAESRKNDFSQDAVNDRVTKLVAKAEKDNDGFEKLHVCPSSPSDVPDEHGARLVILPPHECHTSNEPDSLAMKRSEEYLNSRGSSPRIYRNTLVFAAADKSRLSELEDAVRWAMAWEAIFDKREDLDLNPSQVRTAQAKKDEWQGVVSQRISETYSWLIVPNQTASSDPVTYDAFRLRGSDSVASKCKKKLEENGALVSVFGSNLLRASLDSVPLWRGDHVPVAQLIDDYAQYLYLARLKNSNVLLESISQGISLLTWQSDSFAYAQDFDADRNRYIGLVAGALTPVSADHSSLVVKPDVAEKQRTEEKVVTGTSGTTGNVGSETGGGGDTPGGGDDAPPVDTKLRRFYGTVKLDSDRIGRDAGRIATEVLSHLVGLQNVNAEVTLDISVEVPDGIPENIVRTVNENCRTLKFDEQGFDNE